MLPEILELTSLLLDITDFFFFLFPFLLALEAWSVILKIFRFLLRMKTSGF